MNPVTEAVIKFGSQTAMAQLLGVSQPSVSQWCKKGYMPMGRAVVVAELLGISPYELVKPRKVKGA